MNYGKNADFAPARIDLSREADFSLGDIRFFPSTREARSPRGSETVEPRVMQVLVRLVRTTGAVVSRDDLIESCWDGRAVSDDAINRSIAKVRQLAGNSEHASFVIDTVPRIGYRLRQDILSPDETSSSVGPRKISIGVLPFTNMSNDPEQEYLADGITADIITDLSRWATLAVSSRHATFRFKGKHADPQQVGRELGVRFLVEGTLRRIQDRIRITVQLVEAETGSHVWAERFDRPIDDFFDLQDQVVQSIAGTLVGRMYVNEAARLHRKPPSSLAAYELTLRANALPWDEPDSAAEALGFFEKAIELDPDYGTPYGLLATMLKRKWENDLSNPDEILERAMALARRGVQLADHESTAHAILGTLYMFQRSFDLALRECERAIELNPANQWNQADYGELLSCIGRAEEGVACLLAARRAYPYFGASWYWRTLGLGKFVLRRYEDALADFAQGSGHNPPAALAMMAGCYAKLGQMDRAEQALTQCFAGAAQRSIAMIAAKFPFKNQEDIDHVVACLRLAGLRE
jgi:TolB-like protein